MNNAAELTREGSQLWNPTSKELTAHAAEFASQSNVRHVNNFPPSRHCTEQFADAAGSNQQPSAGAGAAGSGMIDFTAPNVREQIAESEALEGFSQGRGFAVTVEEEDHYAEEAAAATKASGPRQVHNPYSVKKVYLAVDPVTGAPEHRQQSDYFPAVQLARPNLQPAGLEVEEENTTNHNDDTRASEQQQLNENDEVIPATNIVTFNAAGIAFMPPRPPSIESYDVFVKCGDDPDMADTLMTSMIYRWYSLCAVNVKIYRSWYRLARGGSSQSNGAADPSHQMVDAPPPNPAAYIDLSEWYFAAEEWWEANFATHQPLRHHSRSAAGLYQPTQPNSGHGPSRRAPAVPQQPSYATHQ